MRHEELLLRIAVATLLGGVIGYERDLHGRPAGLRTHMIVAMASATFMAISTHFVYFQHYGKDDLVMIDTSRIAASIVTGIGFLAGGAILRSGVNVQGLTTAAGLWLVAAIGMAAGGGMFEIAVFVTLLGMVSLTLLRRFEDKSEIRRRLSVVLSAEGTVSELSARLRKLGARVSTIDYDRQLEDQRLSVTLDVHYPQELGADRLLGELEGLPGLRRVHLGPL